MAKPFPDSVIKAAFNRSKGRCECRLFLRKFSFYAWNICDIWM